MSPAASGERISSRRKWAAIGSATALLTGSFWLVVLAFDMWLGDFTVAEMEAGVEVPMTRAVGITLGGAYAVMGAAFVALALISRRVGPWRGACWPGCSAGPCGSCSPSSPASPTRRWWRASPPGAWWRCGPSPSTRWGGGSSPPWSITAYVYLLLRITLLPGVILAPLLPLPVLAWADALAERRAADPPCRGPGGETGAAPGPVSAARRGREPGAAATPGGVRSMLLAAAGRRPPSPGARVGARS